MATDAIGLRSPVITLLASPGYRGHWATLKSPVVRLRVRDSAVLVWVSLKPCRNPRIREAGSARPEGQK